MSLQPRFASSPLNSWGLCILFTRSTVWSARCKKKHPIDPLPESFKVTDGNPSWSSHRVNSPISQLRHCLGVHNAADFHGYFGALNDALVSCIKWEERLTSIPVWGGPFYAMINQWPLVYRDSDVCGYREHMIGGQAMYTFSWYS